MNDTYSTTKANVSKEDLQPGTTKILREFHQRRIEANKAISNGDYDKLFAMTSASFFKQPPSNNSPVAEESIISKPK